MRVLDYCCPECGDAVFMFPYGAYATTEEIIFDADFLAAMQLHISTRGHRIRAIGADINRGKLVPRSGGPFPRGLGGSDGS